MGKSSFSRQLCRMDNQSLQDKIKRTRRELGWTQQDLAHESGVSLRTVQRLEKNSQEVSSYTLKQIGAALKIPLGELTFLSSGPDSDERRSVESVKALYLSSAFFVLWPLLGLLVPVILGYVNRGQDRFYKKHLHLILAYFSVFNVLIVVFVFLKVTRIVGSGGLYIPDFTHLVFTLYGVTVGVLLFQFFSVGKIVRQESGE